MKKEYRNELGKLHREDGPAVEYPDGSKVWFINGKIHREDGPAIEYSDGDKWWYLNGIEYTEERYYQELLKLFHERLKEDPESREIKQEIKKLETKLTAKKYGL